MTATIQFDVDADGIATLAINVPDVTMNVMTPQFLADLATRVEQVLTDAAIKGAVITSAKDNAFMAGADLKGMAELAGTGGGSGKGGPSRAARMLATQSQINKLFRRMETGGKPFACAINGLALGGGLEVTLACHYRVCADDPKLQLGLPEVKVGLLPGAGGTQRLPRLMGVMQASQYLLQGLTMSPKEALGMGVVHEVAPAAELVARAKAWVKANPRAVQPWDTKGFKVPGGSGQFNPAFVQLFVGGNAMVMKQTNDLMNAPKAIMSAVYEGLQLPMDRAVMVESKYFTKLMLDPQAMNMTRTLFVSKQAAEKGARRPAGQPKAPTRKLAMLGAGMMGAGIAYVSARAGIEVVLLDRDLAAADKGKDYSRTLVAKDVSRNRMTKEKGEALLALITPTDKVEDLAGCDFVIEAVFEDRTIKADITKRVEAVLGGDTIFGSNTSTLPITGLADAWSKPENFIGVHFFSPVDKMPLVEIILGRKTGDAAIAKALDYAAQIRKTPIVVNDSRGFYTSRCFGTYVMEGTTLLGEGATPALIENCGRHIGMPVGPLAVSDEVSIELGHKVMAQARKDLGDAYKAEAADAVVEKMMALGRIGKKAGKGYYDYPADGQKTLWTGAAEAFGRLPEDRQPAAAEVRTRLLYRQLVECARCFAEGVLTTPEDGDLGAIFGWGFAPHSGGPFSTMDTLGLAAVVRELDRLAQQYGDRFAPPQLLRDMAAKGETFYGRAAKQAA